MSEDVIGLLTTHTLFRDLDCSVIERVADLSRGVQLSGGQTLFFKGDDGDALYGVLSGHIRISSSEPDGKEVIFITMGQGDVFGEIALLDGRLRTADAMAISDCSLFQIRRTDFRDLMEREPRLTTHLLELVCERPRVTSEMLEDPAFLTLPARLAKRLIRLAQYETPYSSPDSLEIKFSQAELGQLMSTSRESINKHLQSWPKEGWIDLGRGRIMIKDTQALAELV
ncbi:MAG: Crp/Fnr family transcriptional regulator [Rhodospirillaceae bacterium]